MPPTAEKPLIMVLNTTLETEEAIVIVAKRDENICEFIHFTTDTLVNLRRNLDAEKSIVPTFIHF